MVGLGASGYWAAKWLAEKGAKVTVSDARDSSRLNGEFLNDLHALGVSLETGKHHEKTFLEADAVVLSPGVPLDTPFLRAALKRQIPVLGEMELAARHVDAPIIAVTGTNGKTTVTSFLGQMLENAGLAVFVGGNIGTPLTAYLMGEMKADYLVVEISSFQLDTVERFSPEISMILNISPDHLDRYVDYSAYAHSKLKIFENQGAGQTVILNDDDTVLKKTTPPAGASVLRYGLKRRAGIDAFVENENGEILSVVTERGRFKLSAFSLAGAHNLENLLAAVLAGQALGLDPGSIQKTINEFKGLSNRLERVSANGHGSLQKKVQFYNDSKATNVDAAVKAVQSFNKPVILIAGGRHKGSNYQPLVNACKEHVKGAVFIGEAASLLAEAFTGEIPFSLAETMPDAVKKAAHMAESGDVVLLAPACSSFDMFENYDQRGRAFKSAVEGLSNGR